MRSRGAFVWAILILLPCWGCGQSSVTPVLTVPVKGKITYKGQPLTKGTIAFEPTDRGKDAFGEIQSDGTFVLTTYKPNDGAVVGTHRVYVTGVSKSALPLKYAQPSSSHVEIDVNVTTSDYPIALK